MQSFRSELEDLENPQVERDIVELADKISQFKAGKVDEEKFRSLRLARGVYGQRQPGVQMIRIKLPYGKMTVAQFRRIADVADRYSTGRLHTTTRQDIQIHYVRLDDTPQLWAELERDEITLREACGNTVRNVTASPLAGVDPHEPFDVTPHAHALFEYFLRNPIGQDLGRKFKVAFSSSQADTAYAFMHDLGFIPRLKGTQRGFKVVIGGGLGAQGKVAQAAYDFLPEDKIIPFAEALIRVFDRHGERAKRHKARLKFLLKDLGLDQLLSLVQEELITLPHRSVPISREGFELSAPEALTYPPLIVSRPDRYRRWLASNVIQQKQEGFVSLGIKLATGDISTDLARKLALLVEAIAADDIRITIDQNLLLRFVPESALPHLFEALHELNLAEAGYGSTADITACPGTDTCNLGISNSTGVARALEALVRDEYPDLQANQEIRIKISGCMNSCGQHSLAGIGFHGSSMKVGGLVAPALQVLLGGGPTGDGAGVLSEKVIKIPSKRATLALRTILDHYLAEREDGEYFHSFYHRLGKIHFYNLLKPFADSGDLGDSDFIDWEQEARFAPLIGVGECAGVTLDLVATLFFEAEEKVSLAEGSLAASQWSDAIYHAYSALLNGAKAVLVDKQEKTNTHAGIIADFDRLVVETGEIKLESSFASMVYELKERCPDQAFAQAYVANAQQFVQQVISTRNNTIPHV